MRVVYEQMNGIKRYTVVCPGSGRYDEDIAKAMRKANSRDPRLHWPRGWYSDVFPTKCPGCGDAAQPRGAFMEIPL